MGKGAKERLVDTTVSELPDVYCAARPALEVAASAECVYEHALTIAR